MKKFFKTFEADDAEQLNNQIIEFTKQNNCKEIKRSPAAYAKGNSKITVTSTFREVYIENTEFPDDVPDDIEEFEKWLNF